ncbi:hypothetical protein [uncultured Pseudomonas sp.]|uniref:hypothetical protein n=1 Tax=uncultured Pseudomonas sp. TaxID=114707 RepID=UPI0025D89EC2|nr:hypothetical protein [uncultured Pseudomonas sp.]
MDALTAMIVICACLLLALVAEMLNELINWRLCLRCWDAYRARFGRDQHLVRLKELFGGYRMWLELKRRAV